MPQSIRRMPLVLGLAALVAAALAPGAAGESLFESQPESETAPYIVVFEDSVEHPGNVARAQTAQRDGELSHVYDLVLNGYAATLPKDEVDALRDDPRVRYVVRDRKVEVASQDTPTGIERSFAAANEGLAIDEADQLRVNADVAVIDSGIDFEHPDLNVVVRTSCVPLDGDPEAELCVDDTGYDGYGHGTHVAGTVAALDDGEGVVGVAPGARLWAVKVLNDSGSGFDSWVLAGVEWVTAHAAQIEVANMSLGRKGTSVPVSEAIEASAEAGVVYAVAAGNDGSDAKEISPANHPDVITVSALADYDGKAGGEGEPTCKDHGLDDTLATFSNYGKDVEVAAPGVCILSTLPGGKYGVNSGTSMASPHVAGAAAVLASQSNPEDLADVEAIRQTIVEEGNQAWEDSSEDGQQEPLLDLGNEATFAAADQVAVTGGAEATSSSEATLHGLVNPGGLASTYHFEYGETAAYGTKVPLAGKSAGSGTSYAPVKETIAGLEGQTLYHYRLVATNAKGTFYGADRVFGTTPPLAQTGTASAVSANSAVLEATVNPEGLETTYRFEYGTTTAYGRRTPAVPESIGSGAEAIALSDGVSALNGDTTYHFRVVADSPAGRVYGEDQVFTTEPSRWTVQSSPNPSLTEGEEEVQALAGFLDISCASASDCIGVGAFQRPSKPFGTGAEHPLAASWDGEEWTLEEVPDPNGTEYSLLKAVSCASAAMCMAVGEHRDEEDVIVPLAELWDGEEWTLLSAPKPASSEWSQLHDVSCVLASECIAVGAYASEEKSYSFAASWDGEEWSLADASKLSLRVLEGVSCPAADECVAVGRGASAGNAGSASWNGSKWTLQEELPPPAGKSSVALRDLYCSSTTACVAVGTTFAPLANAVANWNGEDWSVQTLGSLEDEESSSLNSISCASISSCMAVGLGRAYGPAIPIAWRLGGGKWLRRPMAMPNDGLSTQDWTVSCTASLECQAAGYYLSEEAEVKTLVQRYLPSPSTSTSVSEVADKSATLNATINPEGASTTYQFEYGTTTSYGTNVPVSPKGIGSGIENVLVNEPIKSLQPATTYHFRVKASNSKGTTYSNDLTFKTNALTPSFSLAFGTKGTGNGQLDRPAGIATDAAGNLWVVDSNNNRIQKFNSKGEYLSKFGSEGTGNGQFKGPFGIAIDASGNLWVADTRNHRIQKFSSSGEYLSQFGTKGSGNGQLNEPYGIAIDASGNIWVADTVNHRIQKFNSSGTYLSKFGSEGSGNGQFKNPMGIAIDAAGNLWVVDSNNNRIQKFNSSGTYLSQFGTKGSGNGQLTFPYAIAIDAGENLWVSDFVNNRIEAFSPQGGYLTQFGTKGSGNGQFNAPHGVEIDANGDFWIADGTNNRVQKWVH